MLYAAALLVAFLFLFFSFLETSGEGFGVHPGSVCREGRILPKYSISALRSEEDSRGVKGKSRGNCGEIAHFHKYFCNKTQMKRK